VEKFLQNWQAYERSVIEEGWNPFKKKTPADVIPIGRAAQRGQKAKAAAGAREAHGTALGSGFPAGAARAADNAQETRAMDIMREFNHIDHQVKTKGWPGDFSINSPMGLKLEELWFRAHVPGQRIHDPPAGSALDTWLQRNGYNTKGIYSNQTAPLPDQPFRAERSWSPAMRSVGGSAAPRGAARAVRAPSSATIAGYKPKVNQLDGRPAGIYVDRNGRNFVTIETDTGPVTFMYSSGTSMLYVNRAGKIDGTPQSWIPVGKRTPDDRYQKYKPASRRPGGERGDIPDARFGGGNVEIGENFIVHLDGVHFPWASVDEALGGYPATRMGRAAAKELEDLMRHATMPAKRPGRPQRLQSVGFAMHRKHGWDWRRRIWSGKDSERIRNDVDLLIKHGLIKRVGKSFDGQYGKYPAADSEFGRIAAELNQLSPDGRKTEALVDLFGPGPANPHEDFSETFNDWRDGILKRQLRESRRRRVNIIIG